MLAKALVVWLLINVLVGLLGLFRAWLRRGDDDD
jgi:type IV secretory pathway TrbL component